MDLNWLHIIEVLFLVVLSIDNGHLRKKNKKLEAQNTVLKYNLIVNGIESPRGFYE